MSYLSYAVMSDAMPRTYALLNMIAEGALDDADEVTRLLDALRASGEDTSMEIVVRMPMYEKTQSYGYYSAATFTEVIEFLHSHIEDIEPQSSEVLTYVLIRADNIKYNVTMNDMSVTDSYTPYVSDKEVTYGYYDEMMFRLALKPVEQQELLNLLDRAYKINTGEIVLDEKK